jgi:intermediate cleaving peptidase 55
VSILASAEVRFKSGAVFYPYRQDSNFFYLTGFNEPESVAVIKKTGPEMGEYEFHMFVRPKDSKAEQWSGPWSGLDAARDVFNADHVYDINDLERSLPPLLSSNQNVWINEEPTNSKLITRIRTILGQCSHRRGKVISATQPLVHQVRSVKSRAEVANMRKAGQLSGRAITKAMGQPWAFEKDLALSLEVGFNQSGGSGSAYVPVVAGGSRGNMIHYVLNDAALRPGELVLVDAGGEYGTYITDITRTWPVSGKFSKAQRNLYEAVLRVQRKTVALCRQNAKQTLDGLHRVAEDGLTEELKQLGFDMSGDAIHTLFPHHVGHHIGLDVHDLPNFTRAIHLVYGNCITIEPGIYVPDDERWPKQFRGMAIRIEDSVCVDKTMPYILTTEAVKEVDDIEALRS